jgi:DNA-binding response OmpR family regulator
MVYNVQTDSETTLAGGSLTMEISILIVEDDPILQVSLSKMLKREGHEILAARSMTEARQRLEDDLPTMILLDLGLPDGSGMQILEQLQDWQERPLVIVTTGDDSLNVAIEALRLGAFDYITKPINFELLIAAIRRAVTHHQLQVSARILERLQAQEEAVQATARAAAHHISQCLTIIMGEAQMLQEDLQDEDSQHALNRIVSATERAAQTLTTLRQARHYITQEASTIASMLDLNAARSTGKSV